MNSEELTKLDENIRLYLAAWMWHLFAVIFLCFSLVFFAFDSLVFFIPLLVAFGLSEFMAYKRRDERMKNG